MVMEQLEQQIEQALSSGDWHKVASLSAQLASHKDHLASASEEPSSEPIVFGMADVCTAATAGDAAKMRQFLKQDAKAVITARNAVHARAACVLHLASVISCAPLSSVVPAVISCAPQYSDRT